MKYLGMILILALATVCAPAADLPGGKLFGLAQSDKSMWLTDTASGQKVFRFGNLSLQWAPQNASAGEIEKTGADSLRVNLVFANDNTGQCNGYYDLKIDDDLITVDYTLNVPESVNTGGALMERFVPGGKLSEIAKSGIWTRHAHGGVPYEEKGAILRPFPAGNIVIWEEVTGNPGWSYGFQQHVAFKKDPDDPAIRRAQVKFMVLPRDFDEAAAAAVFNNQPLALNIDTGKPFNLFTIGDAPEFKLVIGNPTGRPVEARITVIATSYDGAEAIRKTEDYSLDALEQKTGFFDLPRANRPDIWFVEASGVVDGKEVFLRTTVSAMERHEFKPDPKSIFGMANYFPLPNRKNALELLRRIGVAHLRHDDGNVVREYGMDSGYHSHYNPEEWTGKSEAEQIAVIRGHIARIKERAAIHWEFGNENKFTKPDEAQAYVRVLNLIRRELKALLPDVQLLSIGFANGLGGVKSLELVAEAGGWPFLDGIAYHLGRGNTVPDLADAGDGWFYLSSLQELENLIRKYGAKPVYLTEVYTPSLPNSYWDDSLRNATENISLIYAIAMAHGVRIAYYYQFNDSVWFNVGGVNPKDREYFFGLLNRDNSLKPMVLAYQTTAKMLEGAKFEKEYKNGKHTKGYVFTKPDGSRIALIWDRSEGYNLNRKVPGFAGKEPWIPFWEKRTSIRLDGDQPEIRLVNMIGQERKLPVANGRAVIEISGEPVWVAGGRF